MHITSEVNARCKRFLYESRWQIASTFAMAEPRTLNICWAAVRYVCLENKRK